MVVFLRDDVFDGYYGIQFIYNFQDFFFCFVDVIFGFFQDNMIRVYVVFGEIDYNFVEVVGDFVQFFILFGNKIFMVFGVYVYFVFDDVVL